jgi:hypothetical protein
LYAHPSVSARRATVFGRFYVAWEAFLEQLSWRYIYSAAVIFVICWLGISVANMWVGVAKAGYTLNEEFPIFLLIFGVPTIIAVILKWRVF